MNDRFLSARHDAELAERVVLTREIEQLRAEVRRLQPIEQRLREVESGAVRLVMDPLDMVKYFLGES